MLKNRFANTNGESVNQQTTDWEQNDQQRLFKLHEES